MKLKDICEQAGLQVKTWAPGDGMKRYRFAPASLEDWNYFKGGELFTAIGRKEALTFVQGFLLGRRIEVEH